jgi:hypothetical protein
MYRQAMERIRWLRATRGIHAYNAAKKYLPAVTFAGMFRPTRSKTTLVQHSGLVHGDLDHLDDVHAMKALLCANASTTYCFISPGGDGLKLGISIVPAADDEGYKYAWQVMAVYYQVQYGVSWDPSGKDIYRLCFVSWDPDCYINPDAQQFPVLPAPPLRLPASTRRPPHGSLAPAIASTIMLGRPSTRL